MTAVTQDVQKSRFYAGLYLRTKTRTRFWGWGTWGGSNPAAETVERPWAAVADWLRVAHSLAKSGPEIETQKPCTSFLAGQEVEPASQPAKPRMRFVCTRHFVGLVIR